MHASERPTDQPDLTTSTPLPAWHTAIVLLLLAALAFMGTSHGQLASRHRPHGIALYAISASFEWLLAAFIWFGCRLRGISFRSLLGDQPPQLWHVLRDILLAIGFLVIAEPTLAVINRLLRPQTTEALRAMLPHTLAQSAAFVLLSLTAAFCEELIFRGYLQRQFAAWTKSMLTAVLLQAIIFGAAHLYQGWKMTITIAVYGCLFGLLAWWRRSLRPGMIAHFLQDGVGGLLLAHALK